MTLGPLTLAGPLAVAGLLWPLGASAQVPDITPEEERAIEQLDLETLLQTPVEVWTPAKTPQSRYEAPAIVTTVTREQIQAWGYRSIAELLSNHPGFYVMDDHQSPNIAVRGQSGGLYSDSSIMQVLINGQPVPFSPTGGTGMGPELVPLSAVERVEIIRGPASSLYGANAFLAMINIRTLGGEPVNGGTAWLAGGVTGEHPTTDLDASLGTTRGPFEILAAVRRHRQDLSGLALPTSSPAPRIPAYHTGPLVAEGLTQDSLSALGTLTYRPRPGRSASLLAYYSQRERGAEFGSIFTLAHGLNERGVLSENRVSQDHLRLSLQLEQQLPSRLNLSLRSSYFQGQTGADDRLEVGSEFYFVRRSLGTRGADADAHLDWTLLDGALSLSGGGSLLQDSERLPSRIAVAKQRIEGVGVNAGEVIEPASVRQGRKTFRNIAAYAQAHWRPFAERLGLTGGLRYDYHNVYKGQLSWRLGLVGSPLPTLHIKLLHGTAFQAPSPFLLYAVPLTTGDVAGNPALEPQHVNTFELQVLYEPRQWLNLASEAAYNILENKTEFIQQGINLVASNVLRTTSLSWENRVEASFRDLLRVYVSAELNRTETRGGEATYLNVTTQGQGVYPRVMIRSGAVASLRDILRLSVTLSYIGRRQSSSTNTLLNRGSYQLPYYSLLDATLTSRRFELMRDRGLEASVSIIGKNLLDASGPAPGFTGIDYPLSPRAVIFQLNLVL